jgi:hypothetical protein
MFIFDSLNMKSFDMIKDIQQKIANANTSSQGRWSQVGMLLIIPISYHDLHRPSKQSKKLINSTVHAIMTDFVCGLDIAPNKATSTIMREELKYSSIISYPKDNFWKINASNQDWLKVKYF